MNESTPDTPSTAEAVDAWFAQDAVLQAAFEALTPGRRHGYLLHFNAAKRPETCRKRIERARARILVGKGLHDCICGRSARMPRGDGSHRPRAS